MSHLRRRDFLSLTGLAAGGGLIGATLGRPLAMSQQAGLADVPDEILNPVEVSGDEAVPIHRPAAGRAAHVRAARRRGRALPRRRTRDDARRAAGGNRRASTSS